MKTLWKDVKGYEGLYMVNNQGQVKGLKKKWNWKHHGKSGVGIKKEKLLGEYKATTGYRVNTLCKNGKCTQRLVHRLVAETFIPNPKNKKQVNHKNGIRDDNRIENLEWCTQSENTLHAYKELGIVPYGLGKFGKYSNKSRCVIQMDMNGKIVKKWESASDAVREHGFDSGCITHCCRGQSKSHKGYKWKYESNKKDN